MRNTINNIHRDDILWRFYCKRFTVEGKEIESPKNLCRYFWTSVNGFGLWFGREVKLQYLWLIGLVATIVAIMASAIPNSNSIITTVLFVAIAILWSLAFFAAALVTAYRLKRILETRMPPWLTYFLSFLFIAFLAVHLATQGMFWPEFTRLFGDILLLFGYILIGMVAIMIIAIILNLVPHHRLRKLQRVFQTFSAFVSAKKGAICPPVNPPTGFKIN